MDARSSHLKWVSNVQSEESELRRGQPREKINNIGVPMVSRCPKGSAVLLVLVFFNTSPLLHPTVQFVYLHALYVLSYDAPYMDFNRQTPLLAEGSS